MASDYDSIRQENERKYGTDIGRIGHMLLAERYADRTHFIYELLQNAEDAIARRQDRLGSRTVQFDLSSQSLRVSHFGALFTERDVRGICGIAESTKDAASIGRFGIGFKSVYAFTARPAISSGDERGEHFAIENFVWPRKGHRLSTRSDETVIVLPFGEGDHSASSEIAAGLRQLGPRTLLFLRHIDTVSWSVQDGPSGTYTRSEPEHLAPHVRRVRVLGEAKGQQTDVDETWILFDRPVVGDDGKAIGVVEVAFLSDCPTVGLEAAVRPVTRSALVVFFPTAVETHLGFVAQGPYRTTPSRDNLFNSDPWNAQLVRETAQLVTDAVRYFRDVGCLNADALLSLPLNRVKFDDDSMFAPIFESVRTLLRSEKVLPAYGGGYVDASHARLARTQELRALFSPEQLAELFQLGSGSAWLSEEITVDRTPELRSYLLDEVELQEVTPDVVVRRLTAHFLERQEDTWIGALYRFLRGQPALLHHGVLRSLPLVRLEDGSHVPAFKDGQPQAWLAIGVAAGCPTVRRSLCEEADSLAFLQDLGLEEPDAIEAVTRGVLPRYQGAGLDALPDSYAADIERLVHAYHSDSTGSRKEHLRQQLRNSHFVAVVDAKTGRRTLAKPTDVYLATQRLKDLFAGIQGVMLVDASLEILRGEPIREMLEGCGVARHVEPVPVSIHLSLGDRRAMREKEGVYGCSGEEKIQDSELRGLAALLALLPTLPLDQAGRRAHLLWEELCALLKRRGEDVFAGHYSWFYYTSRSHRFDASFLGLLNDTAWIPHRGAGLERPRDVVFQALEPAWTVSPFLLSKIHFRPPAVDLLAREAGIDPKLLVLLKHLGVTTEAELRQRFDLGEDEPAPVDAPSTPTVDQTTPEDQLRRVLGVASAQPSPHHQNNDSSAGAHGSGRSEDHTGDPSSDDNRGSSAKPR